MSQFFPIIGNFPIQFPTGNFENVPVMMMMMMMMMMMIIIIIIIYLFIYLFYFIFFTCWKGSAGSHSWSRRHNLSGRHPA